MMNVGLQTDEILVLGTWGKNNGFQRKKEG